MDYDPKKLRPLSVVTVLQKKSEIIDAMSPLWAQIKATSSGRGLFTVMLNLPFDPIKRAKEVEELVMEGLARKYYRFRPAKYYGGIATADIVGCPFLCAYCWNYGRNLHPEMSRDRYYSPQEVANRLLAIVKKKDSIR